MNININDNGFWIGFWIIFSVTLISLNIIDSPMVKITPKDKDPIAQRIEAINKSGMFSEQKAKAIESILKGVTNSNDEVILEQK